MDFGVTNPHGPQKSRVIPEGCLQMRMGMSSSLGERQEDFHMAAHQRVGLRQTVRGVKQGCQAAVCSMRE